MTNTSHANCSHDNTKSARAKCRRELAKLMTELQARYDAEDAAMHCQLCGSPTGPANEYNDGYSKCCNEPIVHGGECEQSDCAHD